MFTTAQNMSFSCLSSNLDLWHNQQTKAVAAASVGNAPKLRELLRGNLLRYFQNDPQGQLLRCAIQNHQPGTFNVSLEMTPPLSPTVAAHAISAAIRHGFVYAVEPLLPFLDKADANRMVVESVITQQQNFFNLLIHLAENDQSIEEFFSVLQHKHGHDLTQTYYQWKDSWKAQQQRARINTQIDSDATPHRGRKI